MWSSDLGPSPGQGQRLVVFGKTLCCQPRSQGFSRPYHRQGINLLLRGNPAMD